METALEVAPHNFSLAEKFSRQKEIHLNDVKEAKMSCDCLPPCRGDRRYNWRSLDAGGGEGCVEDGMARVTVSLDRAASVRYQRRVAWPWELLVGGVGGIMALMLGYSLICIVETLYFFTVRWIDNSSEPLLDE